MQAPNEPRSWPVEEDERDDVLARLAEEVRRRRELRELHRRITHTYDGPSA